MVGKDKTWVEIIARGPAEGRDEAVSLLIGAGSNAVIEGVLSSASLPAGAPNAYGKATLKAALPSRRVEDSRRLQEALSFLGWSMTSSTTMERDWSLAWRKGLKPVRIYPKKDSARGLLVRASWSRARPRGGEAEVIMDPSMAFGTGAHPTTRMCLKAIVMLLGGERPMTEGPMLDVGTGSGILTISALKLGVPWAIGLEIDPLALKVARKNLRINNVRARLSPGPVTNLGGTFGLITANIFSEELKRLAPELTERLRRGPSYMVLSGILREQAPGVASHYRKLGLKVVKRFVEHEWACLVLGRRAQRGEAGA